eukprot:g6560.t1
MEDYLAAVAGGGSDFKPSAALANYRKQKESSKEKADFAHDPDSAAERKVNNLKKREEENKKGARSLVDLIASKNKEKKKKKYKKKKKGGSGASRPSTRSVSSSSADDASSEVSDPSESTETQLHKKKLLPQPDGKRVLKREAADQQSAAFFRGRSKSVSPKDVNADSKQFKEYKRKREKLEHAYKKPRKQKRTERATGSAMQPVFDSSSEGSSEGLGDDSPGGLTDAARERAMKKCRWEKQYDAEQVASSIMKTTDSYTRRKLVDLLVKQEDLEDSSASSNSSSEDLPPRGSGSSKAMKSMKAMKAVPDASVSEVQPAAPVSGASSSSMKNDKQQVGVKKGRVTGYDAVNFEKALKKFAKVTRGPSRQIHRWVANPVELATVLKKITAPMKELLWTKKTVKTYEQEFARYHEFCNEFEICSLPSSVSIWSINAYAELLAKTDGFTQSRAVYFSHWKSYVSASYPFSPEMNSVYSKSFSILNKLAKPRSQAQGVRLSHLLRMAMVSDDIMDLTVFRRKAKPATKNSSAVPEACISYKQAFKWAVKSWFGMLRLDDAIHAELTTTSGGAAIKFHVRESKGDKHAHGSTFKLACACGSTGFGPWHSQIQLCPVHACSDEDFAKVSGILSSADNARKLWAGLVKTAGEDCIPDADPARLKGHALRVGSITAALQSGLAVEVVSSLARHTQLQTTQDYATAALTDPDEITICWPVARGTSIREACKK